MEYFNKILCVTYAELTGGSDAIIKAATLRQNMSRGNIVSVHRGGGEGGQALYAWSSIPQKYKERYMKRYGDPEQRMKEAMIRDRVKLDSDAHTWYTDYKYEMNGEMTKLTTELIEEYTINASVLKELLKLMSQRRAIRQSLNGSTAGAWEVVYKSSEAMREEYHHTLPQNAARLKTKIKAFKADGYKSLISGKVGNRNTVKMTKEFGLLLIALKRSRTPVYTDEQLFEEGNRRAIENGWKPLKSLAGMKRWLYSSATQQLWYDAVHGENAARLKFGRKQKTKLPTRRDSLWYGDGTRLNLYYQDKEGNVRTTQVYEVIDAMSEVMLGYWISDSEDYEAQYHAFRMAVQTSGHKPYEIVHDNQGGHKKLNKVQPNSNGKGFLDKICHIHRATMPNNGSSKTIEAIFGRFQQQVLHQYDNFTGQNITAKKASSRPNLESMEANKKGLPTLDELKAIYAEARQKWNSMKHPIYGKSRMEVYESSVNEETPVVTPVDMVDMFWIMHDKPATFTDQGITIEVKKQKYTWEVFKNGEPDLEWRKRHTWEKFYVQYDPNDMTTVNLYAIDLAGGKRFSTVARPYWEIHRALQDQSAEEKTQIHKTIEAGKNDRIERVIAGRRIAIAHGTDPEQNGLIYPKLKGLNKEQQEQAQSRFALYAKPPQKFTLGQITKQISLTDWSEEVNSNKEQDITAPVKVDMASVAGKY